MTAPRLLGPADHRRVPWRNGRGMTTEIAQAEDGNGGFLWRFSLAAVTEDGPFSAFPGIDRVIAVAEGEGMELTIDGAAPVAVPRAGPGLAFSGDATVGCTLSAGPVKAANLMVERGAGAGGLFALLPDGAWDGGGDAVIVHALAGTLAVRMADGTGFDVLAGGTALLGNGSVRVFAGVRDRGLCAAVRLIPSR
ncbi:HutD family protein [Azospirillum sp. RWY-5-1]|uniref:HutD family protein n=1 Tax=Azospirillum oleiclasticum TaxID=2735135 RepID=A0ABX2T254_9PROT|nr:HutD family protein [Azospirillum oleiclasticum]NYZ11228.1 HutD family protein [Azospirillum oleiclasticum]NYZ18389.1 HutD family protein [Azospirillum oleiclasticum]